MTTFVPLTTFVDWLTVVQLVVLKLEFFCRVNPVVEAGQEIWTFGLTAEMVRYGAPGV